MPVFLTIAVTVMVGAPLIWTFRRYLQYRQAPDLDPAAVTESVRVDLEVVKSIPPLAASVEKVKWSKLRKQYSGRCTVGGVVVFGPRALTWAPDDRARGLGVGSWQLPWSDMARTEIREATLTASASLSISTASGPVLELVGIDAARAKTAISRAGA